MVVAVARAVGCRERGGPAYQAGELVSGFGGSVNGRFVSCVALPAMASSVATARVHTRALMEKWDRMIVVDDAEVVVSEMVTNAIKAINMITGPVGYPELYDRLEVICLCLFLDGDDLVVEVWDPKHEAPKRRDVDVYDEGGRGLWLIESLCAGWGVRWPPTGGKTVWARLPCSGGRRLADGRAKTPPDRRSEAV
ncbi:ATP-binding protein [Thermopolyspora sp. NPDC052614]|uniref:ATP-binding protein n=1 Tax=Thermopolyspora sp. NPDC052614 TaxID=3155682 RepID=UPI003431D2DB